MKRKNILKNDPIGVYSCGLDGLLILKIVHDISDGFIIWTTSNRNRKHTSKIRFDKKSLAYFMAYGKKVYLSDCITL